MVSYISALSLFILVLINSCFTLPITENPFFDSTTSSFDIDSTTAGYFHPRTIDSDEFTTTQFSNMKGSENEENFMETTPASTMSTDIKRSLFEHDDLEMTTVDGQFESTSDISQQEHMNHKFSSEGSSAFMRTNEDSTKQQHEIETFTDGQTAEFSNTVSYEHEGQHGKREYNDEMESQFTTEFMTLFTSTSSAAAPELYTPESTDFTSVPTSTKKYVGSFRNLKQHKTADEEDMEEPRKDDQKSEKEEEQKDTQAENEGHEHDMPEEEHKSEQHRNNEEEDNQENDTKSKHSTSQKELTEESFDGKKYAVGEYADQETLKNLQTVPSSVAFLDDSQKAVTMQSYKGSATTTDVQSEDNLPQDE